ncbi:acyl carrier protein [Mycobacterium tuberculosis]|uniref:acyl carrier protein n=1 Tax=Mycobacterium tuberculosis TaxID=1773 RepID=UPI003D7CF699
MRWRLPPLFSGLASAPTRRQVDDSVAAASRNRRSRIACTGCEAEQHAVLPGLVRLHRHRASGNITPEAIDPDKAFQDLGFDSLTAVEMRNRLEIHHRPFTFTTLIFDYRRNRLASYIRTRLAVTSHEIKHTPAVLPRARSRSRSWASCRYPGGEFPGRHSGTC